jgi:hypothetical protein
MQEQAGGTVDLSGDEENENEELEDEDDENCKGA